MFDLDQLLRNNIKQLTPFSSSREQLKGKVQVFLDGNENPFGSPLGDGLNRYPDPFQKELKEKISHIKGVPSENIFLGNGTSEAIDILYRAFCNPGKDSVILVTPTHAMPEASAAVNDVFVKRVPLTADFQLDVDTISEVATENTKLIFIVSPNDPTGNSILHEDVEIILNNFHGIVVIDEAYINYSRSRSFIPALTEYPNLVVLQSFSKAWGMAGLRLGMAFASEDIISVFNAIRLPYTINSVTQELTLGALDNISQVNQWTKETVAERNKLSKALSEMPVIAHVFPSDANFLLVQFKDHRAVYDQLLSNGILVYDCSTMIRCENCLRITVGTPAENEKLLGVLSRMQL